MALKLTWKNNILNRLLRNQAVTFPTQLYVALYTAAPTDTAEGTEVSGGGYARQPITFNAPTGDPATCANSSEIVFPVATASWGTVVAMALCAAASGTGNQVLWASLMTPKTIDADDQLRFAAGAITVSLQ